MAQGLVQKTADGVSIEGLQMIAVEFSSASVCFQVTPGRLSVRADTEGSLTWPSMSVTETLQLVQVRDVVRWASEMWENPQFQWRIFTNH